MKIAFILFDGITWLDLAGVYEPVTRLKYTGYLPDLSWDFCGYTPYGSRPWRDEDLTQPDKK